jgi:hypothetical protein
MSRQRGIDVPVGRGALAYQYPSASTPAASGRESMSRPGLFATTGRAPCCCARPFCRYRVPPLLAAHVAQGIERRFPKPCVAGSNPAVGASKTRGEKARRGTQNGAKTAAHPPAQARRHAPTAPTGRTATAAPRDPTRTGEGGAQGQGREGLGGRGKVPRGEAVRPAP